jgi:hypothetical protein
MGFSEIELAAKKKWTCWGRFPDQTEAATPGALRVEKIEPFYPRGERAAADLDRAHAAHVHRAAVFQIWRGGG